MPHYNIFMHRNNIFRKKPDYKNLALEFEDLSRHMTIGLRGKLRYNFDDPEALRAFTCALMKSQFQKELVLPTNRLIPAIPQRLNYICWLEDLLQILNYNLNDTITGLDIGTGASCIFPILGVHRNITWNFIALEIDNESAEYAIDNVRRNGLDDRIKVMQVDATTQISDIIQSSGKRPIHFTTCNPPFFDQEYNGPNSAREDTSDDGLELICRPKSNSNTADVKEAVTDGGEIEFVRNLLIQSESCKEDVLIFTSMLGRKKSLQHYKRILSRNDQITSWSWAELCQGKTIRYAVAWTYVAGLNLEKAPPLRLGKPKKWSVKLPCSTNEISVEFIRNVELLKQLVIFDLKIEKMNVLRSSSRSFEFSLRTQQKSWLNQRRKRREAARVNAESQSNSKDFSDTPNDLSPMVEVASTNSVDGILTSVESSSHSVVESDHTSSIDHGNSHLDQQIRRKRKFSDSCSSTRSYQDDLNDSQDIDELSRVDEDEESEMTKRLRVHEVEDDIDDNTDYLVRCRCTLTRNGHDLFFELQIEYPCRSANDAHDLFQYFKNKLTNS